MAAKPRTWTWTPLAMCAEAAAFHLGQMSVSKFLAEVAAGRIPQAVWLTDGRKAWRTADLETWFDARQGRVPQSTMDPAAEAAAAAAEWDRALDGGRDT